MWEKNKTQTIPVALLATGVVLKLVSVSLLGKSLDFKTVFDYKTVISSTCAIVH